MLVQGGARGFFKSNDQEYGKAAGAVKVYRDQEKPEKYVSEFKGPARVSCLGFWFHAHRAALSEKRSASSALNPRPVGSTSRALPLHTCEISLS